MTDLGQLGDWRATAEWDWVQLPTGSRLHAPGTVDDSDDDGCWADGTTACGRRGRMWIPGILTRMGAPRCGRCCERTGMPQGNQSPKNVEECRPVVERRIAALEDAAGAALLINAWTTECGSCGYGKGGWAASPALKGKPILTPDSRDCPGCGVHFMHSLDLYSGKRVKFEEAA